MLLGRRDLLALSAGAVSPRKPARHRPVLDTLVYDRPGLDAAGALKAGLTAAVLDIDIYPRGFFEAVEAMAAWSWAIRKGSSPLLKVTRAADLQRAAVERKLGLIFASQDGQILGPSTFSTSEANLARLLLLHDLGLRMLGLTHNDRNSLGSPQGDPSDGGLSPLGRRVVEEMGALRMLVDLSHCSDRTTSEAIALSRRPCVVSHAGCRSILDSPRNKPDDQIRALATRGGVFSVFALNPWVKAGAAGTLDDVVRHIEHALKIAGQDHVAFASDGPLLGAPNDEQRISPLDGPDRLTRLCDALAARGHKADVIDKLAGVNFTRLFGEVCG
jgi:membrane dipeptidase